MFVAILCAILAVLVTNSINWKNTELEDLSGLPRGERVFWGTAKFMLPVVVVLLVIGVIALFA